VSNSRTGGRFAREQIHGERYERAAGAADADEPPAPRTGWTGSAVAEVARLAILIGRYPDAALDPGVFLAVVDIARELYLERLKTPAAYGESTAEAVVIFCGRFLQLLLREPALRTCRLGIAEAERLPEASAQYYDAIFHTAHERLAAFLVERCRLAPPAGSDVAHQLLGRTVYPRVFRALLGVEAPLAEESDEASLAADIDLAPIRDAVTALVPSGEVGTP
jgi:hypothetical protein